MLRPSADGDEALQPRAAGGEALCPRVCGGGLARTATMCCGLTRMVVRYRDLKRGNGVLWPRAALSFIVQRGAATEASGANGLVRYCVVFTVAAH